MSNTNIKRKLNRIRPYESPHINPVCKKTALTANVPISGLMSLTPEALTEFIEPIVHDANALTKLFKCPVENVRQFNELLKLKIETDSYK
jgi:hypothetical protein